MRHIGVGILESWRSRIPSRGTSSGQNSSVERNGSRTMSKASSGWKRTALRSHALRGLRETVQVSVSVLPISSGEGRQTLADKQTETDRIKGTS